MSEEQKLRVEMGKVLEENYLIKLKIKDLLKSLH